MLKKEWATAEDTFRANTFVLLDSPPTGNKVEAAYFFGHTPDNEREILQAGVEIWRGKFAPLLLLCGGEMYAPNNINCYSGGEAWEKCLVQNGVPKTAIIQLPRPKLSHTGTEAENLIKHAIERGYKTLSITCAPMHQLRGFITTIAQVIRFGVNIKVYNRPGKPPKSWFREVLSSQGTVSGIMFRAGINGEWDRICRIYDNQYDVATFEEFLKYIESRN